MDASATLPACTQGAVEANDRLRLNLAFVEELFATLRPQEDGGAGNQSSEACDATRHTGIEIEPPAKLTLRAKNFDADPAADISTTRIREDINGLANGTARVVNETRGKVLDEADKALAGPKQQVDDATSPVVNGANQALAGPMGQVGDGVGRLAHDSNQVIDGTKRAVAGPMRQVAAGTGQMVNGTGKALEGPTRFVGDTGRALDEARRQVDSRTRSELQQ